MSSSIHSRTADVTARQPAPGAGLRLHITFKCMGCGHRRSTGGSKGAGVWKRCATCVETRPNDRANLTKGAADEA